MCGTGTMYWQKKPLHVLTEAKGSPDMRNSKYGKYKIKQEVQYAKYK